MRPSSRALALLLLFLVVLAAAASTASGQRSSGGTSSASVASGNPGASTTAPTRTTYNAGNGKSVTVTRGRTADGTWKTVDKNLGPNGAVSVSAAAGKRRRRGNNGGGGNGGDIPGASATSAASTSRGSPYSSAEVNGARSGRNSAATAGSVAISPRGTASTTAVVGR